jgi:hypothetical protein
VVAVSSNLANVSVAIKPISTDTQLVLDVTAAANSGSGVGDLFFTFLFPSSSGPTQTLIGAIKVNVCKATGISQASAAQGTSISNFTVTGTAFDTGAATHDITVSGPGINVFNVQVVDEQTMKCDLTIENTAAKNQRSVTVKAGTCQFTLPNAFTVT